MKHSVAFLWMVGLSFSGVAQAGVFNIPRFVNPDEWAAGLEPELTLTNGAGLGFNAKFTYGLGDLSNAQAIIGSGSGSRSFRFGGNLTFDFFPDIDNQPGIGLATQALYVRVSGTGRLEVTGIPYIHKAFKSGESEFEPFIAFPLGVAFSDGNYVGLAQFAVGSGFKGSEHFRYTAELDVNVNNTETAFAFGVTYYP